LIAVAVVVAALGVTPYLRSTPLPACLNHVTQRDDLIRHDAIDAKVEQSVHLGGVIDRPDIDGEARAVRTLFILPIKASSSAAASGRSLARSLSNAGRRPR
jgi:hypothetical protein